MSRPVHSGSLGRGRRAPGRWFLLAAVAALVGAAAFAIALGVFGSPRAEIAVGTGIGQRAPEFSLPALDGARISLASVHGTPTVIWFTAAYCVPCQEGARTLGRILDGVGADRVRVLMVFVDPTESDDTIAAWGTRFGRPAWTYVRGDIAVLRAYGVTALDTKLLFDADGIVRAGDSFPLREDVWRPAIESVLQG